MSKEDAIGYSFCVSLHLPTLRSASIPRRSSLLGLVRDARDRSRSSFLWSIGLSR